MARSVFKKIKEECKKHQKCNECVFFNEARAYNCEADHQFGLTPADWDIRKLNRLAKKLDAK
jgi:hypothetical protein